MTRIVLTGSESTGKTTLAAALAQHYGARLVPEFVRGFAETLGRTLAFSDHGAIARGQIALEDEHLEGTTDLLIQDTDLLSTVVYCRHYFGGCPPWIEETAHARRPDLYLLCQPDLPWVADRIRDRGDRRAELHALFDDEVRRSGVPVLAIHGTGVERFALALGAIDVAAGRARP